MSFSDIKYPPKNSLHNSFHHNLENLENLEKKEIFVSKNLENREEKEN